MKKVKNLFLIMLSVFLLTGCVKFNSSMTINKDKSMDFEVDLLYANKLAEMGGETNSDFNEEDYTKIGYKVNTEKQGDYSGYKLTKSFKSIDDISSETTEKASFSDFISKKDVVIFKKKKGLFKDTYTAALTFNSNEMTGGLDDGTMTGDITNESTENTETTDLEENEVTQDGTTMDETDATSQTTEKTTESSSEGLDQLGDLTGLMNEMEMKLVVNLPYAAKSNNATEKSDDNKKLTWNLLTQNGETTINFEFDMLNLTMIIILAGAGVLVIAAIVVVLIVLKKKKANKDTLIHADYDPSIASQVDSNTAVSAETPAASPVVPEAPVASPVMPEAPAASPVMPEAPAVSPVVPEAPAVSPVMPAAPAASPVMPAAPAVTPVMPEAPAASPVVPEAPAASPVVPEAPAVTPVVPEAPAVTPVMPEAPAVTPIVPAAPVMGPAPIEPQNIAPTNIDANGQNNIM